MYKNGGNGRISLRKYRLKCVVTLVCTYVWYNLHSGDNANQKCTHQEWKSTSFETKASLVFQKINCPTKMYKNRSEPTTKLSRIRGKRWSGAIMTILLTEQEGRDVCRINQRYRCQDHRRSYEYVSGIVYVYRWLQIVSYCIIYPWKWSTLINIQEQPTSKTFKHLSWMSTHYQALNIYVWIIYYNTYRYVRPITLWMLINDFLSCDLSDH